ncbi:unnamed protein product [Ceratitis capitata]|uniref:(Mediterranean fruit fly) hypothetical protein n=1 Tax=Ceratitis capitata TaxID=7213 RepID=A0A811U7W9_CERCA|nr:unnamed protein product [Ceratitis capitata]
MLVDFSTNPSLSGSKLKRQQMSADNISKENGTHNAFHKMQECQETQKKVTVKYPEEKQKDTSQENDCQKLRRSYRSPVKPRRFEPEEIKISIKCKKKSTQRSRIFRECFGSDTESDGVKDNSDRNVKISRQDNCTKSKKKKRESQKRESPEKMENRRKNTLSLENHYTKSETKSPYLKNERKGKTFVELELRRSNRTPVKPRRFEPDIIKSTQKLIKEKLAIKLSETLWVLKKIVNQK